MRFVDLEFGDGTSVLVRIDPVDDGGSGGVAWGEWADDTPVDPVGVGARVIRRTGGALHGAFASLVPVLDGIHDQARRMRNAPDEFSVQFGVQLTSGMKLALVGSVSGTFTVTATWKEGGTAAPGGAADAGTADVSADGAAQPGPQD